MFTRTRTRDLTNEEVTESLNKFILEESPQMLIDGIKFLRWMFLRIEGRYERKKKIYIEIP